MSTHEVDAAGRSASHGDVRSNKKKRFSATITANETADIEEPCEQEMDMDFLEDNDNAVSSPPTSTSAGTGDDGDEEEDEEGISDEAVATLQSHVDELLSV